MNYVLAIDAVDDLEKEAAYYEKKRDGLGMEFLDRFDDAIVKILERPESWPRYYAGTRICVLTQFRSISLWCGISFNR